MPTAIQAGSRRDHWAASGKAEEEPIWQAATMAVQRRLAILRHAKSDWPDGVPDDQRPLAQRGRRNAPAAGRWLREHLDQIDLAVCSPAVRARQTWELAAAELNPAPRTAADERVYAASADALLGVVQDLPAAAGTVVLIGHNPGLQDLVALLTGQRCELKTSAIAVLGWPGAWLDAAPRVATLAAHATPRP
jgi:phosphohistidine phosphatase